MIVLGIDPGSRYTGFGVLDVEGGEEVVLDYGVLNLASLETHALRLQQIYAQLNEVVDQYVPDACAIEMPVYGRNPQSMLKLGRAQAAAMLVALNREIPVTEYTPKEVKKAVTGNGNASKEQVWYMVRALLDITEGDPKLGLDASDALAVALCHAHRYEATTAPRHGSWASFLRANPDRIG